MTKKSQASVNMFALHREVTGSLHFISVKSPTNKRIKFIVDCGMFQEEKYQDLNQDFPFKVEELDFALVTHGHIDHIGRLPVAVKQGFTKTIYTTYDTKVIMGIALEDSYKILKKDSDALMYTMQDVKNTISQVKAVEFNKTISVAENVKVTFFVNGHIPGAALILVQISEIGYEDINLLFTGDYNNTNLFFEVPELPEWVTELPLTVIAEATYGDTLSTDVEYSFIETVYEATRKSKDIVIPCISLDRMQKELYKIKYMQDKNLIPNSYRIGIDGKLAQTYTSLYTNREIYIEDDIADFLPRGLEFIDKSNRQAYMLDPTPKITLTSSGMGSFGPARVHILDVLENKAGLVLFTSYLAEGTLGRKLQETVDDDTVHIGEKTIIKRGTVKFTSEDSSHAKADEMIEFLKKFKNLNSVLINHGEIATKYAFREMILKNVKVKNVEIMDNDRFFRISTVHPIKVITSKFL